MEGQSLTQGNVYKVLVRFAIPFMLANVLQILYGATDLFVVGHFATTADVSAVSIGSQIMHTITQFVLGLTTGVTVLLGQYSGGRREGEMAKTVGTSVLLFSLAALLITLPLLALRESIVAVMNTPLKAVDATLQYLTVCLSGTVFIVGYNVISGILRGMGDSKTPLLFVAVACFINVTLDFILVKYVHLGALGAAIATVAAQAGSLFFALFYLWRKGLGFAFSRKDVRLHRVHVEKILKIGAPIALQNCLIGISFLIITKVVNQMGLTASAGVGVVEKLIEFLMVPAIALGAAVAAMSAQNFGAGEFARAKKCLHGGIAISLTFAVFISIFCWFQGILLTGLFTTDPEVAQAAALYLKTYSLDCLMVSFVFNINGYLSGCNHSLFSMIHSLLSTFAIRIPATIFLGQIEGVTLTVMGCASPLSTLFSVVLCIFYLSWLNRQGDEKLIG